MTTVLPRRYLDYAAAAPLSEAVRSALLETLALSLGNPSAVHGEGVLARRLIETARKQVATVLHVQPQQVTFLSGGTEANALAIHSALMKAHEAGKAYTEMTVITTAIEHPSLLTTLTAYEARGVRVVVLPVTETGRLEAATLESALDPSVALVTFGYVNSEVGTIQPVRALLKLVRAYAAQQVCMIHTHIDAAQAPYWVTCQFGTLEADTVALDAAKCGGPLGSGVLVRSRQTSLRPLLQGGVQEQGNRAGTEAILQIVGAGVALAEAQLTHTTRAEAVQQVRDAGIKILLTTVPGAILNGAYGSERVANNINLSIPGVDTEFAVVVLDAAGVAASTKSACAGAGGGESGVVRALTNDPVRARSTLRFTLGPDTTREDLSYTAEVLAAHVRHMKTLTN